MCSTVEQVGILQGLVFFVVVVVGVFTALI